MPHCGLMSVTASYVDDRNQAWITVRKAEAGNKRLVTVKDSIVFLRRDVTSMQGSKVMGAVLG